MMLFCSCFQVEKNTAACDLIARTVPKTLGSPLTRMPTRSRHEMPATHGGSTPSPTFTGSTTGTSTISNNDIMENDRNTLRFPDGAAAEAGGRAAADAAAVGQQAQRMLHSSRKQPRNGLRCCFSQCCDDASICGACAPEVHSSGSLTGETSSTST